MKTNIITKTRRAALGIFDAKAHGNAVMAVGEQPMAIPAAATSKCPPEQPAMDSA